MQHSDRVLLVVDAPGQILDRYAKAWRHAWTKREHDIAYASELHAWSLRREADRHAVVHWIDPLAFGFAPDASRVPQIVMAHHLMPEEIEHARVWLQSADAITTVSRQWQKKLRELTGRDAWLIPATIDTKLFVPRGDARSALGIAESEFVIGFSARARADAFGRKGIDLLLATVAEARKLWSDLTLLLIGGGWESLKHDLEAHGVHVVHRVPNVTEETAAMYPAMDVFLCTAREEGGPVTILEAMSCGVPVITSNVGHVPEVIADGVNGFIARERTAIEYLDAIRALRDDAALRARIGGEARRFIERERDEATVLPRIDYEAIYRQAIAAFARRPRGVHARRAIQRTMLFGRYAARTLRDSLRLRSNRKSGRQSSTERNST